MRLSQNIQKKIAAFNKKMKSGSVEVELNYTPMKKQSLMHNSNAPILLYGGAVGGGKSAALVADATMYCLEHPGSVCALFRKTRSSALKVFLDDGFYKFVPLELWNYYEGPKGPCVEFVNGSVVYLCSLDVTKDRDKYQGERWRYLGIDEVTLFKQADINFLETRCRSEKMPDGSQPPRRVRYTANPGGPSHAYIKRLFIDRAFDENENPELYEYIFSSLTDNKYLMADEDYAKSFMSMPESMRKRYLEGDWGIGDGVFLDSFSPRVSIEIPFEIPAHWKRYRSIDYGWADPTVIGWFAISPSGVHHLYREAVFKKTPVETMCKSILELSKNEKIITTFSDPSVFASSGIIKDPTYRSPGLVFARCGVKLTPGNNDRKYGGMMVREHLSPIEIIIDESGDTVQRSKLQIFSTCKYVLDTVPHLVCGHEDPDDIEHGRGKKQNDHGYDMIRYYLTSVSGGMISYADQGYEEVIMNDRSRNERYAREMWDRYFLDQKTETMPKSIEELMNSPKKLDTVMQKAKNKLKEEIQRFDRL